MSKEMVKNLLLAKSEKNGNLSFFTTESLKEAGKVGCVLFQTSTLGGRTPIYHPKSYRSEMEMKQDLLYRFGVHSRIVMIGNTLRCQVTLDYEEKKIGGEIVNVPVWDNCVFLEDFADLLYVGKGDLVKEYSFEKESSSFKECVTNGAPLLASKLTGEKMTLPKTGKIPQNYAVLFSHTRMIDPTMEDKYENRLYTDKAKAEIVNYKPVQAEDTPSDPQDSPQLVAAPAGGDDDDSIIGY